MNKETVGKVVLGTAVTAYAFLSARQAAREVTPRVFDPNEAVLSLVKFDAADVEQLATILPSWMGVLKSFRAADEVVLFPDDSCSSVVDTLRSEARQAFYHMRNAPASVPVCRKSGGATSHGNNNSGSGAAAVAAATADGEGNADSVPRPATLAMRHIVEVAGNSELDATMSPIDIARQCQGMPMEVTTLLALCTGPSNSDVDIARFSVRGRVCSPLFLEKLAAARRSKKGAAMSASSVDPAAVASTSSTATQAAQQQNYCSSSDDNNNQQQQQQQTSSIVSSINTAVAGDSSAASAAACFSSHSANFVTVEDLFEPAQKTGLLDDYELQWIRHLGPLLEADEKKEELRKKKMNGGEERQTAEAAAATITTAYPTFEELRDEDSLARDGCNELTEPFIRRWRRSKLLAVNGSSSSSPLSRLLLQPWKYRAFIHVAYNVMYGQLDRRFGSVFGGVSRGMTHAAQVLKRTFSFSPTGAISSTTQKASSWINGLFSGSSSSNGDGDGKPTTSETAFSRVNAACSDFGSVNDNPLGGDFVVTITVRTGISSRAVVPAAAAPCVPAADGSAAAAQGPPEDVELKALQTFAGIVGVKLTTLENGLNEALVSFSMSGSAEFCAAGALDFALQLSQLGVQVTGVRLHLQVSDIRSALMLRNQQKLSDKDSDKESKGKDSDSLFASSLRPFYILDGPGLGMVPVRDFEARNPAFMSPSQYFETLLHIRVPEADREDAIVAVRRVCAKHEAQVLPIMTKSSSSSSRSNGSAAGKEESFYTFTVSLQMHSAGLITVLEQAESLKKELVAAVPVCPPPSTVAAPAAAGSKKVAPTTAETVTLQRGFVCFDTALA